MAKEIKNRVEKIQKVVNEKTLTDVAYDYFKGITPINKGNARRNTTKTSSTIRANYPYAGRLDEGYSKQAPQGMSQPTWEYIQKYIKNKLG